MFKLSLISQTAQQSARCDGGPTLRTVAQTISMQESEREAAESQSEETEVGWLLARSLCRRQKEEEGVSKSGPGHNVCFSIRPSKRDEQNELGSPSRQTPQFY